MKSGHDVSGAAEGQGACRNRRVSGEAAGIAPLRQAQIHTQPEVAAHESEHLRETVDLIDFSAVRARLLNRGHLHDDALNVLRRDYGATLVTAVFGRLAHDLDQATAAVGSKLFVGDDGQGHGLKERRRAASSRQAREQSPR